MPPHTAPARGTATTTRESPQSPQELNGPRALWEGLFRQLCASFARSRVEAQGPEEPQCSHRQHRSHT